MILWTIHKEEVYQILMSEGVFRCDSTKIRDPVYLKDAYSWLASRMAAKIGEPPPGVQFPVWAFYQWEGERKKPDLRRERWGNGWKGDRYVCMEIDVPDEEVVLTDFDLWISVMGGHLISYTEKEDEELEKEYEALPDQEKKAFMEKNWDRIFDVTPLDNGWVLRGDSIQATFWELKKEYLKKVRFFTSALEKPDYLKD